MGRPRRFVHFEEVLDYLAGKNIWVDVFQLGNTILSTFTEELVFIIGLDSSHLIRLSENLHRWFCRAKDQSPRKGNYLEHFTIITL